MPLLHAVVLGILQGLSEFLPISSSGHLALAPWLLGWNDYGANQTLEKSFTVALHMGTLVAVVGYFWKELIALTRAGIGDVIGRRGLSTEGRLAWLLLFSAVPAAIIGALFNDTVDSLSTHVVVIGVMLIVFGGVLWWFDSFLGQRTGEHWTMKHATYMGLAQAAALQPGVSRSGATMTVALGLRYRRDEAARLSFLMSVPVIAGAGLFEGAKLFGEGGVPSGYMSAFVAGFIAAALSGWFAIWFVFKVVRSVSFVPFAIYRIALGVAVLVVAATHLR